MWRQQVRAWFVPFLNHRIDDKDTPLPIPSRPWESISMDYLMGYPTTKYHHDVILVVIDIFSKMAILIPCNKTTTA